MEKEFSKWKGKYSSIKKYYEKEFDPKYYHFSKEELEIDPDETIEDLEEYIKNPDLCRQEIIKCHKDFSYFCHKYVKIGHPTRGLLPFVLYSYQKRCIEQYEKNTYNIIRKFRQGGLTTVTVLWALWRAMFREGETLLLVSKTDREAMVAGDIARNSIENFPKWFAPTLAQGGDNKHEKHFEETGSKLLFYTAEAARGRSLSCLILDEAAFIKDMERHWAAMFPTLSGGGQCIAISTVNGVGNWYHDQYKGAEDGRNYWNIIDLGYKEHPDYDDDHWLEQMKAQLGLKKFRQEILGDFLGSGVTFIPAEHISNMTNYASKICPLRKLMPMWQNSQKGEISREFDLNQERGALWIFSEPMPGREYIMGVDTAEGVGEEGDNSCIEIIDSVTREQVAEFYSQECPTDDFAKVVERMAIYYNNALVAVESQGPGAAVLNKLLKHLYYENVYHERSGSGSSQRPGIRIGMNNRSLVLESLQNHILGKSLTINSIRFCHELSTFAYVGKKVEATKMNHDDAIMAMSIALYVRDEEMSNAPLGSAIPNELSKIFDSDIYKSIKADILKGAPDDWTDPRDRIMNKSNEDDGNDTFEEYWAKHRKNDALLREFYF